ncbi:MAG: transcriptional repressor [Acidiferrobacterales bacterium]|nr:transcriptional repressor [Acidiferrobacterales bacterium]
MAKANASQTNILSSFHGDHDHSGCQKQALSDAKLRCQEKGLKLTKIRQQVLEIVWATHKPLGAYDVLEKLQDSGHKPAPPTAYRALEFLVSAQLIHRIESLNAYVGCPSPNESHQSQFYICKTCGHVAELSNQDVANALSADAEKLGFSNQEPIIEIHGICADCED